MVEEPNTVTANWLRLGTIAPRALHRGGGRRLGLSRALGEAPRGRGLGLACGSYLCGAGLPIYWNHMPQSGVTLHVDRGGGVAVFCGETEIGQGSDSVLAAVVAEVLGLELARPPPPGRRHGLHAGRPRQLLLARHADDGPRGARRRREGPRDRWRRRSRGSSQLPESQLVFSGRRVFDAADPGKGLSWEEAVIVTEARAGTLAAAGSYTPPRSPGKYRGAGVGPSPTYSYSAAVVEVEVDEATGIWKPVQVWMAHDIGRAINPALVMGQVEGSVYMGLGEAMMEESAFRRLPQARARGRWCTSSPASSSTRASTFEEMPPVTTYLIEDPDPAGPFGAKEVGQGPLLPMPPACANAIFDAVGVRVDQVPIHPHMVLKALEAKRKGKPARFGPDAFPEIDFGFTLKVPTPWEGGDGKATNEAEFKLATGRKSKDGTMAEREEALKAGSVDALTTKLQGTKGD